jgi:hypothetical protein
LTTFKPRLARHRKFFASSLGKKGLVKYGELLKWLKSDCGLGHGHANAIILHIQNPELGKKNIAPRCKDREE